MAKNSSGLSERTVRLAKGQIDYVHDAIHRVGTPNEAYWKKPSHKAGYDDGAVALLLARMSQLEEKLDLLLRRGE